MNKDVLYGNFRVSIELVLVGLLGVEVQLQDVPVMVDLGVTREDLRRVSKCQCRA